MKHSLLSWYFYMKKDIAHLKNYSATSHKTAYIPKLLIQMFYYYYLFHFLNIVHNISDVTFNLVKGLRKYPCSDDTTLLYINTDERKSVLGSISPKCGDIKADMLPL